MLSELEHALKLVAIGCLAATYGGWTLARTLRQNGLRWTWASLGFAALLLFGRHPLIFLPVFWGCALACILGCHWHRLDLSYGADHAEAARSRLGMTGAARRWIQRQAIKRDGWIKDGQLVVGRDMQGMAVSIPVGYRSGSHTLVVGATGSGKTVSEAWITGRLIEAGHGAVVIDPKGDRTLRNELAAAAASRGAPFLEWCQEPSKNVGGGWVGQSVSGCLRGCRRVVLGLSRRLEN